jgi:hypothetical protein
MTRQNRHIPKKSKAEQIEAAIRLLNTGKTQAETAALIGINIRTLQRWVAQPEVRGRLLELQQRTNVIVKSDPVVLSVTEIRHQVQEILDYRDSQRTFAIEMGQIVRKTSGVLLKAVERLETSPDEVTIRHIPPLIRALTDASEKVSNAWARATGLDDLLESLKDEPQVISQGQTEV